MARTSLFLIKHRPRFGLDGTQIVGKKTRTAYRTLVGVLGQRIDQVGIGKRAMRPRTFDGATRAREKDTLQRRLAQA
jgi:hypothetical protein